MFILSLCSVFPDLVKEGFLVTAFLELVVSLILTIFFRRLLVKRRNHGSEGEQAERPSLCGICSYGSLVLDRLVLIRSYCGFITILFNRIL